MCLLVIHSLFPRVLFSCLIGLSLPLSKIRVPFKSAMFHFGSAPKVLGCFHPKILIRISTCHFVPTGWLFYRHPDMPSGLHHNPSHHNVRSNERGVVMRTYTPNRRWWCGFEGKKKRYVATLARLHARNLAGSGFTLYATRLIILMEFRPSLIMGFVLCYFSSYLLPTSLQSCSWVCPDNCYDFFRIQYPNFFCGVRPFVEWIFPRIWRDVLLNATDGHFIHFYTKKLALNSFSK